MSKATLKRQMREAVRKQARAVQPRFVYVSPTDEQLVNFVVALTSMPKGWVSRSLALDSDLRSRWLEKHREFQEEVWKGLR